MTLYIRKFAGMTGHLGKHMTLLTLLKGPYSNQPPEAVLSCDRLLLIGGGIGITGLVGLFKSHVNIKLAWSVKALDKAVVDEFDDVLQGIAEKDIRIGERLELEALLRCEAAVGYKKVGMVVCGPGPMYDSVLSNFASLGRHGKTVFELEVEAFSW